MSRESILNAVKANKPEALPLPDIDLSVFDEDINLIERFKENIEFVGGRLLELDGLDTLDIEIKALYPEATKIVSCMKESALGTVPVSKDTDPHTLEDIDLTIIKGNYAVAENGAVWVSEDDIIVRALPFITNDLILVVPKNAVNLHMHQVFDAISERERTFGVFISGPSKTADIEQCLVVGAHGAISLTVVLY
ncbi:MULTISPECIES: LutC/YkgG family protein [Aestuariibaculum]|uniref:LUD domain-containing protein n=1 Tax=Aestuariibaculum lutulentum TaxID=2920935 RepID=A0ABS9RIN2_9FLAO|nr:MULTISPECIES: LUD domain-containing protein [Aestuariibaculum]MCH4552808.1 LUD domain-containing protein [Aestuariibaculum lutulentum]MCR8669304.1 LUD domain-containing protein [Aestuariibaculum sp. M13]